MKASLSVIVLLATCSSLVSCQSLQQCQESCIQKIPNEQICNETCVQLQNVSSEANHTVPTVLPPPVPDPPRLLTSKYFKFTLEWNDYRATKYNTTVPIRYVLEVTRHKNISDPTVILPFIEKYHVVENSTFTIPQILVTKTNFSFRLAVVAFHGTSNFSAQSPLYTTNNSCEKTAHQTNSSRFNPCPVFNLHLVYTVTPVRHAKPNISTTLYWHHPEDILEVEHGFLVLDIVLSTRFHIPQRCHQDGLLGIIGHSDHVDLSQEPNRTSTVLSPTKQLYFGCHYEAKVHSAVEKGEKYYTTFYIPRCFQGFCGCEKPSSGKVSDLIHVEISSGNSTNRTVANMTWDVQAWDKEAAYFRTVSYCIGCPRPAVVRYVDSSGNKTTYSESYKDLWRGIKYRVNVFAFDQYSCQIGPEIHAFFDAVVPPTVAPTSTPSPSTPSPSTPSPSTPSPSTPSPSTPSPSTQTPTTMVVIPVETSTAPVSTDGTVGSTAEQGLSSATVAAITVPIVLLLFVALAVALCFFYRLKHKPTPLIRAPTGLRRLTDHQDDNVYHRNIRNDSSSAYANEFDRSGLVVNLPAKSEAGLELNPAYVEQRISDAIETGEADEFEVGYHRLEFKQILGKGAFGKVFLAEAYGIGGTPSESLVAVKVLNERADQDEVEDFKMEIEFMKTIGRHDNVLTMLGCCTLYPPLCLVIEYVPHGDLLHYLRDLRKTFERQMNYKPLKDDRKIEPEKPNTSSTLSQESAGPGNFSNRLLVPSVSDTRKNGVKRSHSAASLKSLKNATAMLAARRSSEIPSVHYVDRGPTDVSNTTQMTLVQDSLSVLKAKSLPATPVRSLDGALDSTDLQSFAYQIANGMAYLSERGLVHRDLAARNILVGDEKVLKISDFGLSREGVYVKRSTGKIPLRWLSIEAMRDRIYSTTSDIWAFGIVLWEICTLGGFPYPTLNDRDLLNFLVDEKRMDKPDNCTDEIYHIMLACWSRECEDRPSFQTLRDQLHGLQKEEQPYVNVDPSQDFNLPPTAARDTDGNLISFSDGALSNDMETADQDEDQWKAHLKQSNSDIESDISGINNLSSSRDVENAGYESSTDPEDLTFTANIQTLSPRQPSLSLEDETAESLV